MWKRKKNKAGSQPANTDTIEFIEKTGKGSCTDCGLCVDACTLGARSLVKGRLVIDRKKCQGCGLCVKTCPEGCIRLVPRR